MPDIFSDERKKLKTHSHTYIYTDMCIHIQKKGEIPVNLKPQNSPRHTLTQQRKRKELFVKPKITPTPIHIHTHTTINISYLPNPSARAGYDTRSIF